MYYVNMSMFFAFATLYPEMQVLLYGILPLKVKWLAWLDAALFAYDIVFSLFARQWITAALPIIALLNYFIFFWDDLVSVVRRKTGRMAIRPGPRPSTSRRPRKRSSSGRDISTSAPCAASPMRTTPTWSSATAPSATATTATA